MEFSLSYRWGCLVCSSIIPFLVLLVKQYFVDFGNFCSWTANFDQGVDPDFESGDSASVQNTFICDSGDHFYLAFCFPGVQL
jgi:hypothetical protein